MELNRLIKAKRLELGLTDKKLANLVGLSIYEYTDIEDYPEEAITVLYLKDLRNICATLKLNISDLLRQVGILNDKDFEDTLDSIPLNELIKKQRELLGLTIEALGDKMGFYEQAIIDMESNRSYLEEWPIDLICHLCMELKIPLSRVISNQ